MLIFTVTYQRYDGILWPEIIDTGGYFTQLKNAVFGRKDTSIINVQHLNDSEHKEYRNKTLKMYLNILSNIPAGNCRSDPVQFVRTVVAIFLSVHNCYLCYDYNEHSWNMGVETSDVRYSQLYHAYDFLMTVCYLCCAIIW